MEAGQFRERMQEPLQERFSRIGQYIDDAAQACRRSTTAPDDLRDCLAELDRESDLARQVVETSADRDPERIRTCLTRLEEAGERALQACRQARDLDQQLQVSLSQAHFEIATLRQQLH